MAYEYSMGRPKTIADTMREREEAELLQGKMWAQGEANRTANLQAQHHAAAMDQIKMFGEKRRNMLGLSPLAAQFADRDSAAFEKVDAQGNAPQPFINLEMGDLEGGAPDPIPTRRDNAFGIGLTSQIRDDMREPFNAMRTEDSVNTRAASPYENPTRQRDLTVKEIDTLSGVYADMPLAERNGPRGQALKAQIDAAVARLSAPTEAAPVASTAPAAKTGGVTTMEVAPKSSDWDKFVALKRKKNPNVTDEELKAEYVQRGGKL